MRNAAHVFVHVEAEGVSLGVGVLVDELASVHKDLAPPARAEADLAARRDARRATVLDEREVGVRRPRAQQVPVHDELAAPQEPAAVAASPARTDGPARAVGDGLSARLVDGPALVRAVGHLPPGGNRRAVRDLDHAESVVAAVSGEQPQPAIGRTFAGEDRGRPLEAQPRRVDVLRRLQLGDHPVIAVPGERPG